ncbi:MAG: Aldo/keto reductase [Thermoproteota archaeon]|nr:Aldo/keto reductase [Thermoproteota archaeon]
MEFKRLANGLMMPVLGMGTWEMGGRQTPDSANDSKEINALRTGIDLGMTLIDTAEMYASGHAEELVGEAIKPYKRDDVFITTKVWSTNLRFNDLVSAMKGSLKRLGLSYVDLYLVHWPNPQIPLKETMSALEYCVEEGYTRSIGVSNFSAVLLLEAQSYLRRHLLVADQVHYNLIEQSPREDLLPYCEKNGVIVIAYRPLEKGQLSGKRNSVLDALATKYNKTRAQVCLNWLISQKNVVAIPKASRLEHLKENLWAVGWNLNDEDAARLGESFR